MALSRCICLAIVGEFTLLFCAAMVQLNCQHENLGISRQNSMINCSVKGAEASDVDIGVVIWKKDQSTVLMYYSKTIKTNDPRFQFAEQNWDTRNRNVSLLVTDTRLVDEGQYQCQVITDSGEAEEYTSLKVHARYSKPVMSSIPKNDIRENMRVEIFCNASGGYPAGVIHWYDQYNTNWTRSAETDVVQTEDKLFKLTSKLTVLQASSGFLGYRCVVLNSKRQQEEVAEYNLSFALDNDPEITAQAGDRHSMTITAVLVVVGSLACGLLILMLLRRRRSQRYQQGSEVPAGSQF
uniref:T-lymphocyte activation antigen CD80-like n=1 Tax=Paramormyrops kingsleyae TaxID=1676925 RepID=A0A3B3RT90_9TELE|nr:T-lymphocyte activation antigen CD80-like [Paramormyrops kingsleyae]XP_023647738.1 T-lymphocyte activation antigen CD80-like [Paramormyrops kingsleyae]XP_023647739.1 T-lymphocyte activation antigen CD80-like [Paramormyrops kingsleyae]XP_023647740.1 T-lymphocyte activation antigen CD80-like [Paramormyrops kingsleyae]